MEPWICQLVNALCQPCQPEQWQRDSWVGQAPGAELPLGVTGNSTQSHPCPCPRGVLEQLEGWAAFTATWVVGWAFSLLFDKFIFWSFPSKALLSPRSSLCTSEEPHPELFPIHFCLLLYLTPCVWHQMSDRMGDKETLGVVWEALEIKSPSLTVSFLPPAPRRAFNLQLVPGIHSHFLGVSMTFSSLPHMLNIFRKLCRTTLEFLGWSWNTEWGCCSVVLQGCADGKAKWFHGFPPSAFEPVWREKQQQWLMV